MSSKKQQSEDPLSLDAAASRLLDECRMVLPGIQALFGFQLIAVFNEGFATELSGLEQRLHLVAIVLIVIAIALVMGPAALHRQAYAQRLTAGFIAVSSHLLMWSMLPLALGICLDMYLVARVILDSSVLASALAAGLFGVLALFWFALPRIRTLQRIAGHDGKSTPATQD